MVLRTIKIMAIRHKRRLNDFAGMKGLLVRKYRMDAIFLWQPPIQRNKKQTAFLKKYLSFRAICAFEVVMAHSEIQLFMYKPFRILSLLLLLPLLFMPNVSPCQKISIQKTDSLRNAISNSTGEEKINTLIRLSANIAIINREEALAIAQSALQQSKAYGIKKTELEALIAIGKILTEQKKYDEALAFLDSAQQMAVEEKDEWHKGEILYHMGVATFRMGDEMKAIELFSESVHACRVSENFRIAGSANSIIGTIFRINGLYDRAIEYIIKARLNYEKADFMEGSAWSAYLLGRIYSDLKLYPTALRYFNEALDIYSIQNKIDGNGGGLAICYEQLGLLEISLGNYEDARKNFELMMQIYTRQNSKDGISSAHKNMGILEYYVGNYAEAEELLKQAFTEKTQLGDPMSIPGIYEYLGLCMLKTGRNNEGLINLQKGLDLAVNNNQKKIQLDIYSKMADAYMDINNLVKAIFCLEKQIEIQNLLLSGDANIKQEQLQAIYEIEEKNEQIAELERQNRMNELNIRQQQILHYFMIFGIVLALFLAGIIYWFYNKLRRKNRELNETNAAKDKLFTIIAHDLRGPTSSLAALLDQMNTNFDDFDNAELKKMLLILSKSSENVNNLLDNLLIWTQAQLNKIDFHPAVHSLDDILQNAIFDIEHSSKTKEIDIKVTGEQGILVKADADMLQIILRNILSNAIKFTNRGGQVIIEPVAQIHNRIKISITDNGVGIDKQMLEKLFDITNTQHTRGTENEKSTGLGLILVKYFVEKNKGTLTIDSEKGKGTTVSFTLPAALIPSADSK